MSDAQQTATFGFQAEVKQLLHLMIHSLYSNREIFLRELISNASDAADRLRFEALSNPELLGADPGLQIRIETDPEAGTVSVVDNGIGMSRAEVLEHLGTIAKSGTADFLGRLSADQQKDAGLIGQFGVGFYSAFIVAARVEVESRRADLPPEAGVHWSSDGQGEFTVAPLTRAQRGTRVTLTLREDAREFLDEFRLRALVAKYSDHIAFPVLMQSAAADGEPRDETLNTAQALWARPRSEISDDEYRAFYKHVAHDFEDPLTWSHNRVEGRHEYTSLLYLPAKAPWDLWNRSAGRGLKLYVKRVFILDDAEQFLPLYLRFVRGVVDSSDLSLNVSREMLQQDERVEAMRGALTRRVLSMLEKLAAEEPDKYAKFWAEFGRALKEGPAEDPANRERIAGLLRFTSTRSQGDAPDVSLAEYLGRKPEGQSRIFFIAADSLAAARSSPQLEVFRASGIEVLLLTDPLDEWLVAHLGSFSDLAFQDARRASLDLGDLAKSGAADQPADDPEKDAILGRLREQLGEQVADVRVSSRLTESPACLVLGEHDPGRQMRRLMEASGQPLPPTRPILEINPGHPLMRRLAGTEDASRFADLAGLVLDQATLAEGGQLADPGAFVQRLNRILLELSA